MRIKFKKGVPPEIVANTFLEIMRDRQNVIGTVNIYVQEYGEDMKMIKQDQDWIEVSPTDAGLREYGDYSADLRRNRLKAI